MRYRYVSPDLFVVQEVPVPGVLKNVLPIYRVIEFVWSLSTVLNAGTLSPKNALPVYRHLILS